MENVLRNMANRELLDFCKENGIDPSGTICQKDGRGFRFSLYQTENGYKLVTVLLSKGSVPTFTISLKAQEQRNAKIKKLRENMPGYILGDLTQYASDSDVLEVCEINNRKAEIHNRALNQSKLGK